MQVVESVVVVVVAEAELVDVAVEVETGLVLAPGVEKLGRFADAAEFAGLGASVDSQGHKLGFLRLTALLWGLIVFFVVVAVVAVGLLVRSIHLPVAGVVVVAG